jgi:tetratricopeptide (TPR) repeat protein
VRGYILERLGRWEEARDAFERAHELKPNNRSYIANAVKACHRVGDVVCALKLARRLKVGNIVHQMQWRKMRAYATSPQFAYYRPPGKDQNKEQNKEQKIDRLILKALSLLQGRKVITNLPQAEPHFKKALAEDPNYLPLLLNYGLYLGQRAEFEQALSYFRRGKRVIQAAKKPFPKDLLVAFYFGYAACQHRGQKDPRALYQKVLELDPNHSHALYGLGTYQTVLGNRNKALDLYKKLKPVNDTLARRLFTLITNKT